MTSAEFKELRVRAGMTQQAIADFLGVDIRTAQRYEAGSAPIKGPALKLLQILEERIRRRG